MPGVGVDADDPGDRALDPGFLERRADRRPGGGLAEIDRAAGDGQFLLSVRRIRRISPRSLTTTTVQPLRICARLRSSSTRRDSDSDRQLAVTVLAGACCYSPITSRNNQKMLCARPRATRPAARTRCAPNLFKRVGLSFVEIPRWGYFGKIPQYESSRLYRFFGKLF
jgi:hypothetical protein